MLGRQSEEWISALLEIVNDPPHIRVNIDDIYYRIYKSNDYARSRPAFGRLRWSFPRFSDSIDCLDSVDRTKRQVSQGATYSIK